MRDPALHRRTATAIRDFGPKAIILSGGPASTTDAVSPKAPPVVFELGVPVLGICYGEQTMVAELGGSVVLGTIREFGRAEIELVYPSPLFDGIMTPGAKATVWMSHGDKVAALPDGFVTLAQSPGSPFAAIADEQRRFYGLQFHPEVMHTEIGGPAARELLPRHRRALGRLDDGRPTRTRRSP